MIHYVIEKKEKKKVELAKISEQVEELMAKRRAI